MQILHHGQRQKGPHSRKVKGVARFSSGLFREDGLIQIEPLVQLFNVYMPGESDAWTEKSC